MKEQYYKQVWIESERDIPKKGRFWTHQKMYEDSILTKFDFGTLHRRLWLKNIDWYLQPILQPKGLTDEEINEQATEQANKHPNLGYYEGYYDALHHARDQIQGNLRDK